MNPKKTNAKGKKRNERGAPARPRNQERTLGTLEGTEEMFKESQKQQKISEKDDFE
jgi:hypothetical protein